MGMVGLLGSVLEARGLDGTPSIRLQANPFESLRVQSAGIAALGKSMKKAASGGFSHSGAQEGTRTPTELPAST